MEGTHSDLGGPGRPVDAAGMPVDKVIPQMREYVETQAFGARRIRLVGTELDAHAN